MLEQMKLKLADFLEEKLIPKWSLGRRRLTPGVGYLESLTKFNVSVVYGEINEITDQGYLCDEGIEYPVDVLICDTSFDTTFKPHFPLIGSPRRLGQSGKILPSRRNSRHPQLFDLPVRVPKSTSLSFSFYDIYLGW
jgi:hypothetical protein